MATFYGDANAKHQQAVAYQNQNLAAIQANQASPPPLTLASALSRADALNERIIQLAGRLSEVAGKLGTLRPVAGSSPDKASRIASGVVERMNEAADVGHARLSDAEALLSGIERALG